MAALHLSEAEAYLRISAARASRTHPILLTMLADGRLHLTAIDKVAPHLTPENREQLLERATYRSKRQILELIAEIAPRPDVPAVVRKLPKRGTLAAALRTSQTDDEGLTAEVGPEPTLQFDLDVAPQLRPDGVAAPPPGARRDKAVSQTKAPAEACDGSAALLASPLASATLVASKAVGAFPVAPAVVQPLSPGRYEVQFTAGAEFCRKLERLRALMGNRGPGGDLAAVIEQAVTEKLERLEARRFAKTTTPRQRLAETKTETGAELRSSRHIPAAIRRVVRQRDGDRCRYVDVQGRRCPERNRLEYHHRHPFALGGDHSVSNIALVCRAHNGYLADCDYGREAMANHRTGGHAPQVPPA
jgi:5-methylcytosine-specific restriction endonuclease McrA